MVLNFYTFLSFVEEKTRYSDKGWGKKTFIDIHCKKIKNKNIMAVIFQHSSEYQNKETFG